MRARYLLPVTLIALGCASTTPKQEPWSLERHLAMENRAAQIAIADGCMERNPESDDDHLWYDLTPQARQCAMDHFVLQDAMRCGYLPKFSRHEDLTLQIRERMYRNSDLCEYTIDGRKLTKGLCPRSDACRVERPSSFLLQSMRDHDE